MTVANSPRKKRRASSLLPNRRKPAPKVPAAEAEAGTMDTPSEDALAIFNAALGDDHELKNYNNAYDALLAVEAETAWDHDARPKPASRSRSKKDREEREADEIEREADAIIRAMREYERKNTFGNLPSEALPEPWTLDMGGQFLTNKDRIEKESILYQIAGRVPKGALLHLHFNAELYPEALLKEARSMPNMYIRSIKPLLTEEDLDTTEVVFNIMDEDKVEKGVDIFSPEYPGTATNWKLDDWKFKVWMKWSDFQKGFDEIFSNENHLPDELSLPNSSSEHEDHSCGMEKRVALNRTEKWLYKKMVLSEEEAYGPSQTVNG